MADSLWSSQHLSVKLTRAEIEDVHLVERPYALLGSHPDCDIAVSGVASKCLLVLATGRGIRGLVLSRQAKKAGQLFRIDPNRSFRLGQFDVTVAPKSVPVDTDSEAADGEAPLAVVTWKADGCRRFLQIPDQKPILLGRSLPAELRVEDGELSGVHGCLVRFEQRLFVIDLLSTNGISVAGDRIRCSAVDPGKSFKAGKHYYHFVELYRDAPTAKRPHGYASLQEQNSHAVMLCARLDGLLQFSQSRVADCELRVFQLEQERNVLATTCLTLHEQLRQQEEELRSELKGQQEQLNAKLLQNDELVAQSNRLREANVVLKQLKQELEARLAETTACYDELKSSLLREDGIAAERVKLLADAEADLREREAELEQLRRELTTERLVLQSLRVDDNDTDELPQPAPVEDDTCISSLDFHEMLAEALEALPAVDQQESDSAR